MPRGVCTERGGPPNNPRDFFSRNKKAPPTPIFQISREKIKRGPEYSSEPSGCPFFGQSKQINEISWFVGKDVAEALGYSNAKVPILGTCSKEIRHAKIALYSARISILNHLAVNCSNKSIKPLYGANRRFYENMRSDSQNGNVA